MENSHLKKLLDAYKNSDNNFKATSYWASYETEIIKLLENIDLNQLRSGKYPILATFGFGDVVYTYHPNMPTLRKVILQFIHKIIIGNRGVLPYGNNLNTLKQMAIRNCVNYGKLSDAKSIESIEVSKFGNPKDIINHKGKNYTVAFLDYYFRYCFINKFVPLKGDEIIVELGSGSGYQVELLKKLYPDLTIICFDLPSQLYLCETYIKNALGASNVVSSEETIDWENLNMIEKGKIHFLGSWKFPILKDFPIDIFWNAASFGEMEPDIVQNYLSYILPTAKYIYLLQAQYGKETTGVTHVKNKITFENYSNYLNSFDLIASDDVQKTFGVLPDYFQAVWKNRNQL